MDRGGWTRACGARSVHVGARHLGRWDSHSQCAASTLAGVSIRQTKPTPVRPVMIFRDHGSQPIHLRLFVVLQCRA